MSAGAYDITCEQGVTFNRTLTVKDSNGDARDLSTYTARMQVRVPLAHLTLSWNSPQRTTEFL